MSKAIYITNKIAGTREIVDAVLSESNPTPGLGQAWRVVRGMAMRAMALRAAPEDHPFMTTADFAAWLERHGLNKRGAGAVLSEHLGMSLTRRAAILDGAAITRIEALACAHYAAGLPLPIANKDAPAFSAFVVENFGRATDLAKVLNVTSQTINERMEGFQMRGGLRLPKPPQADMIRAVDWVRRVGPFSPYGPPLPSLANMEKF